MKRRMLAPANFLSILALVMTCGVAYAAIGSTGIANDSLLSIDLRNGAAVANVDVVNNALRGDKINESTLVGVNAAKLGGKLAADYALTADVDSRDLRLSTGANIDDTIPEVTWGPVVVELACYMDLGVLNATIRVHTLEADMYFESDLDTDADLDPEDGYVDVAVATSNGSVYDTSQLILTLPSEPLDVFSNDQAITAWTHHGGKDCWFTGQLVNNAA